MMQAIQHYLLSPETLLFLLNLAVGTCLACCLGLLAVHWCRRWPAPVRHGVLVGVLCLLCLSPLLLGMGHVFGWGGFHITFPTRAEGPEPEGRAYRTGAPSPVPGAQALSHRIPISDRADSVADREGEWLFQFFQAGGTLLACIWCVGSGVVVFSFLRGLRTLGKLRKTLKPMDDTDVKQSAIRALQMLGIRYPVPVYQTPFAPGPFSLGLFSPQIVLPEDLPDHLDKEEMLYIFLHEAAHIRRRDHWVALLQLFCAALFWWTPLVRAVNAHLARLREEICDDHVVWAGGNGRRFAAALVRVAEWGCSRSAAPLSASLIEEEGEDLEQRIRRLLRFRRPRRLQMTGLSRCALGVLGLCLSGLLILSGLRAGELPRETTPSTVRRPVGVANLGRVSDGREGVRDEHNLGGKWLMRLPAGFEHTITLVPVGPNRYRLGPGWLMISGIYEVQDGKLLIVEPNDWRLDGFLWEIRQDGRLILVGQPPVVKTGSNYLGATLVRQTR